MHPTPLDTTIDTVVGYLHRRRRSGLPLAAGEAATVAVAVVRGCAAAPSRAVCAQWRLTAGGRPVLVDDPGGDDVLAASVAVLGDLTSLVTPDVRPGFARLRDALLTEPPPTWDTYERRLLGVIEPQPLVLGPLTPTVPEIPPSAADTDSDADIPALLPLLRGILRRVRPRVAFAGVGAAAAVLAVAVMMTAPPGEPVAAVTKMPSNGASPAASGAGEPDGDAATVEPPAAEPAERPQPAADDGVGTDVPNSGSDEQSPAVPDGAASDDLASAASAVLSSLATCLDDACAAPLREGPADLAEPAPLDPRDAQLDVIDDFGGLAVIRLTLGEREQYVTLVRGEDRWLVRSVRDVADQPS